MKNKITFIIILILVMVGVIANRTSKQKPKYKYKKQTNKKMNNPINKDTTFVVDTLKLKSYGKVQN